MRSTLSRLLSFAEQLTVPSKSAAIKSKGKERAREVSLDIDVGQRRGEKLSADGEEVVDYPDVDDPRDEDYVASSGEPARVAERSDSEQASPSKKRRRVGGGSGRAAPAPRASRASGIPSRSREARSRPIGYSSAHPARSPQTRAVPEVQDEGRSPTPESASSPKRRSRRPSAKDFVPRARQEAAHPRQPSIFVFDDVDGHDTASLVNAFADHLRARRFRGEHLTYLKGKSCVECARSGTECEREHHTKICRPCSSRNWKCSFQSSKCFPTSAVSIQLIEVRLVNVALESDWDFSDMIDAIDTNVRTLTVSTFSMWQAFETLDQEVQWLRNDLHANMNILLRMGQKLGLHVEPPPGFQTISPEGSRSSLDLPPDESSFHFSPLPDYGLFSEAPSPPHATGSNIHAPADEAPAEHQEQSPPWPPPPSQLPRGPPIMSRGRLFGAVAPTGPLPQEAQPNRLDPSSSTTVQTEYVPTGLAASSSRETDRAAASEPAGEPSTSLATGPLVPASVPAGPSSIARRVSTYGKVRSSGCRFIRV